MMNFNYEFNSRFIWYGPFNTKFYIDNNVYIPRSPIADHLQELIKDKKTILDLCCGSGALGIMTHICEMNQNIEYNVKKYYQKVLLLCFLVLCGIELSQ